MSEKPIDNYDAADEPSDRELRISQLLAEFLKQEDEGTAVSRDEFLAANEDVADDLNVLLEMANMIQKMAGPPSGDEFPVSMAGEDATPKGPVNLDDTDPDNNDSLDFYLSSGAVPPIGTTSSMPEGFAFGDYQLLEVVGQGGMGIVYRARQAGINREVAVKMIRSDRFRFDRDVARFYKEAQTAGSTQHPNIVTVFDIGEVGGRHYYSMQYVEGTDLASLNRESHLSSRRMAEILKDVADGVHAAHEHGILHRDLKPANVLIRNSDGKAIVTDFGLAKQIDNELDLTRSGDTVGTPSYMSPEQARADEGRMGAHSDVYSIGAILYELITGVPPFKSDSAASTVVEVLHREVVPPSDMSSNVNRQLEAICLKCLAKNPLSRYSSAKELAGDFARMLDGRPVNAVPISKLGKSIRWLNNVPFIARLSGNHFPNVSQAHKVVNHLLWVLPLLILCSFVLWQNVRQSYVPDSINIGTGMSDQFYHQVGTSLKDELANNYNQPTNILNTSGSIENVKLLKSGQVHIAIAQLEVLANDNDIAKLTPLYADKVHIVIRKGQGIQSLKDLEDRVVSLGPRDSGMRITSERVLSTLNIDHTKLQQSYKPFQAMLTDPAIEAGIVTTRTENAVLRELLNDNRFELIGLTPQQINDLTQIGYHRDRISGKGLSQVEAELTPTVATMAFLVSNANAGEALVKRMLTAIFVPGESGSIAGRLNLLSRTAASQHPVDFHPAALEFFANSEL